MRKLIGNVTCGSGMIMSGSVWWGESLVGEIPLWIVFYFDSRFLPTWSEVCCTVGGVMFALQCDERDGRELICVCEEMWHVDELFYLWVLQRIKLILAILTGASGACAIYYLHPEPVCRGKTKNQIRYIRIRPDCPICQKHPGGSPSTSLHPFPYLVQRFV